MAVLNVSREDESLVINEMFLIPLILSGDNLQLSILLLPRIKGEYSTSVLFSTFYPKLLFL